MKKYVIMLFASYPSIFAADVELPLMQLEAIIVDQPKPLIEQELNMSSKKLRFDWQKECKNCAVDCRDFLTLFCCCPCFGLCGLCDETCKDQPCTKRTEVYASAAYSCLCCPLVAVTLAWVFGPAYNKTMRNRATRNS